MRRWLIGIGIGLACAAGLSAFAVTAGGFSARPWLQALGVGEAAPAAAGNAAISGQVSAASAAISGTIGFDGAPAQCFQSSSSDAILLTPSPSALWSFSGVLGDLRLIGNGCYTGSRWQYVQNGPASAVEVADGGVDIWTEPSGTAGGSFVPIYRLQVLNDGTVEANGHDIGQLRTYGNIIINASSCSISTADQSENVSGCTFNGTGNAQANFATPYTSLAPSCVASTDAQYGNFPTVRVAASNTAVGITLDNSGTLTSGEAYFQCIGN
jgi:hypothetical protein